MSGRTYGDAVRESLAPIIEEATAPPLTITSGVFKQDRSDPQSVGYELLARAAQCRADYSGMNVRLHEVHDAMIEGLPSGRLTQGQSMLDVA